MCVRVFVWCLSVSLVTRKHAHKSGKHLLAGGLCWYVVVCCCLRARVCCRCFFLCWFSRRRCRRAECACSSSYNVGCKAKCCGAVGWMFTGYVRLGTGDEHVRQMLCVCKRHIDAQYGGAHCVRDVCIHIHTKILFSILTFKKIDDWCCVAAHVRLYPFRPKCITPPPLYPHDARDED